jgi:hypothetical protein
VSVDWLVTAFRLRRPGTRDIGYGNPEGRGNTAYRRDLCGFDLVDTGIAVPLGRSADKTQCLAVEWGERIADFEPTSRTVM